MKQDANTFSIRRTTRACPCHACAFFTSKEEEYRVMLPFMAEGFGAGKRVMAKRLMKRAVQDRKEFGPSSEHGGRMDAQRVRSPVPAV
jgi:hypothetical protein